MEKIKYYIRTNKNETFKTDEELFNYVIELEQQCKKQKGVIDKAINDLNIILEIIREQPSESNCWIINRLEANKKMLKEVLK
jgi:hypothetical protein